MADDVSKKYALNIEVNVDSSSLNNLKNIQEPSFQITSSHQEDVFEKLFDSPKVQSKQTQQIQHSLGDIKELSTKLSEISNKVDGIKSELEKRDTSRHSEHITNASNLATSDIARSVAVQIMSAINDGISPVLSSGMFKTSHMSAGETQTYSKSGQIDSSGIQKKIAATTGKKVTVHESQMSNGEYGEYEHSSQAITINSGKSTPVKKLALNHEATHTVQEAKGYTGNTQLFHANANTSEFYRNQSKYVNEYLTNTAAIIRTALAYGLDESSLKQAVEAYKNAISKTSGVVIKDINHFTDTILKMSSLNISPETFMSNFGNDVVGLGNNGMTNLSKAAALVGYHTKSDGSIRNQNGKIISDNKLLRLTDEDGKRINQSDIASHRMAYFVSNSANTLRGASKFNGRNAFLRSAGTEFFNMSDFGIQFMPAERLEMINSRRQWQGLSYSDIQRRIRENTAHTHRGETLYTEEEAINRGSTLQTRLRKPGNVQFGLQSPLEKIMFAIGGNSALDSVRGNVPSGYGSNKQEILDYIKSYVFDGTGTNEEQFQLASYRRNADGMTTTTKLGQNYGKVMDSITNQLDTLLKSGDLNSATFIGTNAMNTRLGDLAFYARALKRGVKAGYIPDTVERVKLQQSEIKTNKEGDQIDTIENAELGHLSSEQLSQGEEIDLRNYERKRLAYDRAKKAVENAREKFNKLRLGGSSGSGLIATGGSSQIMIGSRQISSIEDIDRIERRIESEFANYQRENPEIAKKEAVDNMLTSLKGIIGVLHGGEDARKISTEQLKGESIAVIDELNAIPDSLIEEARRRNSTIKLAGVDVGVDGIIKTREAIREYKKTMRNISSGEVFSTSKMAEEEYDATKDLEDIKRQKRNRRIELAKDHGFSKEEANSNAVMAPILRKDPTYRELQERVKQLEAYLKQKEESDKKIKAEQKRAKEKYNADLQIPTSYRRKVNGETVERNVKFDKNEASVMGSIYEKDYGAYNMAVGNLEALSTTTQAPLEILKKIRKNRSYMNFVGEDGNIKDFASPLTGAMSPEAILRMRMLENPLKRILETSGSISGNAPKRIDATKDMLADYLHRGEAGARHQLGLFEEFFNKFKLILDKNGAKDTSVDESKAKELYSAIKDFNERSILSKSGLSNIDASVAKRNAEEIATTDISEAKNRMLRHELRQQYDEDIKTGRNLLSKRGFGFNPVMDSKYNVNQYKLISEESIREGDFASGSSTANKYNLIGAAEFLSDKGRKFNPYTIKYKEGLTTAHYDLGDLKGYGSEEIHQMVRAAQDEGLKNTTADLIEVSYHNGVKKDEKGKEKKVGKKTETTARDNSAFETLPEKISAEDVTKKRRELASFEKSLGSVIIGSTGLSNKTDNVVREFSDNMRKIVERALNGGASSETIKRIAEDVSAIKGILSNVNITTNSVNTKKSGGMFETSKMSAEDSAINDSIEAERRRRIEAAKNIENEYSNLYEDETANRIQQTSVYDTSAQKRLEKSEFEAKLSELSSKREKLALIDEKINSMNSEMDSMTNEDRLKSQIEINRLRKKRVAIENSPGTKEDKIEFNEWRDVLRSQQKEFISKLKGKGSEDISKVVSEEIKRLLNLEENRSAGNYDKKSEIQKLTTKLKEFEQSSRIKNDKNSLSDAINELKRKYKGEDNAFDATLKGAGIDDRPEKLRKEVERLNSVLDELKVKKEEALNAGDDTSAKFYDTLIFQRQIRKDVVQGKQNAADKSLRIADENAAARALKEAERAQKQEQRSLDAMASAHDKEGNQARSVFNKAVEYGAMSTLVYGFASEAKNAIDIMSRFERQMVEVTKVMDPLYKSQELLTESAKRMAVQYGVSIIESAKGMSVFAQQGKNAAQIIQLTEASLLAANTTTLNAAQATEALTATIRQFNLTDSDAKRVIDSWLEVESRTAISAQTMADAIKISGTAARVAGLSFDEFNGILSAVGSATRETGSQLGTAFKFIISKMRTDDAVTALNRLGIATHNQNGDYRDLMVVLSDLNSKWVEMSQEQKASTAIAIAGTRRYNTLMTLMEKWDDALDAVSMSEDSHGKAMRMNAAIMDTYEKKVQKARASVEAFYASMSKGTTKGFLGGIQESISMFAGIAEKTPLASNLAQAGVVASGISFFSRIGGSMGLGSALGDLKANSEIKSEISKAIASEVKSSIGNGKALFRSESSRRAVLERLDIIDSGKNVSSEMNKDSKFLDGRDALAKKITERIAGVNEKSELYQSTLKRVQNEISRTISSHKEYIEKLREHKNGVARFGIAAGEFAKKHAAVIAAIGIGLQTLANSEFFKDEKSLTGKTTAGEVVDLAGSLGTAIGAGAAASQFGGPWAGVAVGALSMLGPLVSNLQSWGEKITGSTRLTLLRLQEESDRLKTLTTSIDSYSRLREKERSGQALTLEEQEQKRVLEQNISLASPTAIKIGHRGVGSYLDEGEFEKLVGRKTEFKDKYASISDQMAYEQMFSETFGGKTISDDLRKNLFTEQKALEVQLSKLRDFDAKHTGELSESERSDRMKIIEEIKKIQERVGKGNTAINEVEQAFFASVRNRESGVLNATRRGESYEANDVPNDRIRKMFEQIVANRNGNISEARKVTSEAILSGIISRGIIKNRTTAIENAQRTGMLYSATRGRELEGGKQEIILHTRAADGSVRKSESIVMDKKGSDDDYIREVATRKGLNARSIAYTSELSDTLFRYSLKEVEKFSELTRKIGDTIYNSYKNEVDRISSIEGISSKFRIGGIDSQYRGSDTRLEEALRATLMRTKSAGTVDSELIKKMADYAKNSNPSKAMFAGAEISSQIARHNTLAGATEHLIMSMSTQVQKSNMANQIIEAIYKASFKTERGRDGEVSDIGGEEKRRINEYLAMAGLGFDEFDKIRESLSGASEEDFKRALISRVSAAADIMAKKDSNDISKYFKLLEDNVERLANIMKQTAEAIEINRKDSFAANLDYSGMVFDRDIVNSYKSMAKHASMYDDEITRLSAVIEESRNGVDIQKNAVDQALKTRDEATTKYGKDSQQAITANDNYLRLRNNYDQALSSLNISLEKLDNLRGLQQQLKAMTTGSFGEHRAFMRTVASSAIGESTRNGNISFGTGSPDYNNISLLAEQNKVLGDRRMDIQSQYDAYAQMAKYGKLTEAQKTEMKSLELQLGEIDKAIRENGMKLDTANMNLEKTYAEARRNTRRLQLEHLANALSGSKDTGRSQKAMFDDNYNRMRGLWRDYVSAMQQNPNAVSEDQKQYMKELAKKMENLRDIGDLMGNPAFNKNYLLASAQDQAIADNIMQRLQSGETMRQIFSDAGMKEMGRNNPLISQLMDNMMQKQENQRLADVSNQMLDVETEMLGYLKNIAGLMNDPMFRTKIEEGGKSNRDAKKGFANGTIFTGSGGKFESAGLVEVHKGEGLGVLSQTAMARYPMMSRKVLQMISDMNTGTYPGFANGTRVFGGLSGSNEGLLRLFNSIKGINSSNIEDIIRKDLDALLKETKVQTVVMKSQDLRDRVWADSKVINENSIRYRYSKKFDLLPRRQQMMITAHEQIGHGNILNKNTPSGRFSFSSYGHAAPELFSDVAAMAVGRKSLAGISGYQTSATNKLFSGLKLDNKSVTDAFLSIQKAMINNPKVIAQQLAHIQSGDPRLGSTITKHNFTQAGLLGVTPFANVARSRGDERSAARMEKNILKLADRVFAKKKTIILEDFADDFISGKIGMNNSTIPTMSARDIQGGENSREQIHNYKPRTRAVLRRLRRFLGSARRLNQGVKNGIREGWNVAKNGAGYLISSAMRVQMLKSAAESGIDTYKGISTGDYFGAAESGLRTLGSLNYAGVSKVLPNSSAVGKLANKSLPLAFYAAGGLELARGIKNGDADKIISGSGNIANAALYSRPVQNLIGNQAERVFGVGSVAKFGKGMGFGMVADLLGTGIEMLGDHYNKPWLKRIGQVGGGAGEAGSDVALTYSTMGLNKVVSGAIDAGRFLFDDKYREDYGNKRAHVGGGFIALEQISKLFPGASGGFRMYGADVPNILDEINSHYANANTSRYRDEALRRNRTNVMGALLTDDKLKYGSNANREDKMAATAETFEAISQASKGMPSKGLLDASQAGMEAYFRDEDASEMMDRYYVSGKRVASVIAQKEMAKLHARLSELDKEDTSLTNSDSIPANTALNILTLGQYGLIKGARYLFDKNYRRNYGEAGYHRRLEEREKIEKRLAKLREVGSFDIEGQVENTREAAQEHFDELFGRKANVFGKGGILEGLRRKRRDAEVKREEEALSKNQGDLAKARKAVFNNDKLMYSYASLADMEHAAKMGDKKAQSELSKFNERASKDKSVTDVNSKIATNKKRIIDLKDKKIDGSGKISAQDFYDLRQFENSNIEIQTNNRKKDIYRLKSQEKKLKEDIDLMKNEGSSADAIKKKQAELQGLQAQIGKATGEVDQLLIGKRISDKLASGKLADPRKLASEASEMEEKRKVARAVYDDPNKIRELNAGKTVTVKIGNKEVELNKEQTQAWRGISDDVIAKKRAEQQTAQNALGAAVLEETVRQDLIKENGGDASKVTDDMVRTRIAQNKENSRKEAEKRENERQYKVYRSSVFGKREAAQKAFDDSVARRDKNKARIAYLENKMDSGAIEDKEKEELREAKNMQLYYDKSVGRNQGELNRTNRAVVARQRAAREGHGGDARLIGLSEKDYNKEKLENEESIKRLEVKRGKEGLTDSEDKELFRRKNMTRTLFIETDLRRFRNKKARLSELRQKKADGMTLSKEESDEMMSLSRENLSEEKDKELVSRIDNDYRNKNGGMSFEQLKEEESKERRRITLDNIGLKKIKYNKETGRYEAEDDKKANTPSADERTESLGGEDTKQIADAFGGGPRTAGVSGTSQTTAGDDKNIGEISKDTAAITETLAKVLEKMGEILKLIPNTSDHASEKNTPPKEGDRIPT